MKRHLLALSLAASMFVCASESQASIVIQFDYSQDTLNFFTPEKRRVLDQVASIFETNIINSRSALSGVTMGMGDYTAVYANPQNGPAPTLLDNQSIARDTVRIFVGAADLVGNTLAIAQRGTLAGSGGFAFSGWGGSMVFDIGNTYDYLTPYYTQFGLANPYLNAFETRDWYVDDDIRTTETLSPVRFSPQGLGYSFDNLPVDFASVAMHEMGHIFGLDHSNNPGDAMAPNNPAGERRLFGRNDWLAMLNAGWLVNSLNPTIPAPEPLATVPETPSLWLVVVALTAAAFASFRRPAGVRRRPPPAVALKLAGTR